VLPANTFAVAGLTVTVATGAGAGTVIEDVPVCVSLVAVIVAVPAPTAVTRPLPDTVATALLSDAQVTVRPVRRVPPASRVVAVNCWVLPTTTLAVAGLTVTLATGATLTGLSEFPSQSSIVTVLPYIPTPGEPPARLASVEDPSDTPFLKQVIV
jgi:hypothetical protein